MNLTSLSNKIKDKLNSSAEKILPSKVKDELGLNKPTMDSLISMSDGADLDGSLNNFYQPVQSNFLSQRDYRKIRNWGIALVALAAVVLLFLFINLIIPHQKYSNALSDSQLIIDGNRVDKDQIIEPDKVSQPEEDTNSFKPDEELEVQNITISESSPEELAKKSPMLQSDAVSLIEYKIKPGDTMDMIAERFYGNINSEYVNKIKTANNIRNVRLIRAGQKIIIPI